MFSDNEAAMSELLTHREFAAAVHRHRPTAVARVPAEANLPTLAAA